MSGHNNLIDTNFPLTVPNGGLGTSGNTAYAVLCAGTTTTGAVQSIASVGSSGNVLTSNGASALPTFQAAPLAGKVLQAVQGLLTTQTTFSSSGGVYVNLGLNVSITPSSASNKIFILVSFISGSISTTTSLQLLRGTTAIDLNTDGTASNGTIIYFSSNSGAANSNSIMYIDSPATTSSITYGIKVYPRSSGGQVSINSAVNSTTTIGAASTIIALEIAG